MNEGEFITKFNETILNFKKKKKKEREVSDSFSNSLCKREDCFFKHYYSKHL